MRRFVSSHFSLRSSQASSARACASSPILQWSSHPVCALAFMLAARSSPLSRFPSRSRDAIAANSSRSAHRSRYARL